MIGQNTHSRNIFSVHGFLNLSVKVYLVNNNYRWKEKVQKNTGRRRKVQVTKAAFKGLYRFVFFTVESLPCSETQPSK